MIEQRAAPGSARWQWSAARRRYIHPGTGRAVAPSELRRFRNRFATRQENATDALAARHAAGQIDTATWLRSMRQIVKDSHGVQHVLGRGGRHAMTQSDWGRLGNVVRGQYEYLQKFAQAIERGEQSAAQVRARAALYVAASVYSFERGNASAYDLSLPAYPGDGGTPCLARCRCHWDISSTKDDWLANWVVGGAVQCPGCRTRAEQWNPLRLPKERGTLLAIRPLTGRALAFGGSRGDSRALRRMRAIARSDASASNVS